MSDTTTPQSSVFQLIVENNKNELQKIEQLKSEPISRKRQFLIFSAMMGFAFFGAGLIMMEIIKGLVAFGFAGIILVGTWYGIKYLQANAPLILQKQKNKALEKMMANAKTNCIAQLKNQILKNAESLAAVKAKRDNVGGMVKQLEAQVNTANTSEMSNRMKAMLEKVQQAYDGIMKNIEKATVANEAYKDMVTQYEKMYNFANMADEVMSMLSDSASKELENMLSMAAFEEIDATFCNAMAKIDGFTQDLKLENQL